MGRPTVELLWWKGCPSWPKALEDLHSVMADVGLDPESVVVTEVRADEDAERKLFVGSPTIRIDGKDVQPPGPDEPVSLTCRIYRLRDGRVSPTPDPEDVRAALAAAADGEESDER